MGFYDNTYITLKYRQLVYLFQSDRDVLRRRIEMETGESLETVRDILWNLCMSIDKNGNKGYSQAGVIDWGVAAGYSEDAIRKVLKCKDATNGILFLGTGSRKKDFTGYGVRKNPPWQRSWCELYGYDNDKAQAWIAELWDEALEHNRELEARKARPRDEIFGMKLESVTTDELGKRWALLFAQAQQQYRLMADVPQWLGNLYGQYAKVLMSEIVYRANVLPEGDEKKLCMGIIERGIFYFFTFDTWQWIQGSKDLIDIDWNQPLPISWEAKHAQQMSDRTLLKKVLMLADPEHGAKERISPETYQLILSTLRKLLKNARGDW